MPLDEFLLIKFLRSIYTDFRWSREGRQLRVTFCRADFSLCSFECVEVSRAPSLHSAKPPERHYGNNLFGLKGFATSRARSMNSCATELSVRFLSVITPIGKTACFKSIGKILIS